MNSSWWLMTSNYCENWDSNRNATTTTQEWTLIGKKKCLWCNEVSGILWGLLQATVEGIASGIQFHLDLSECHWGIKTGQEELKHGIRPIVHWCSLGEIEQFSLQVQFWWEHAKQHQVCNSAVLRNSRSKILDVIRKEISKGTKGERNYGNKVF